MAKVVNKNDINNFEPAVKVDLPFNVADLEFMNADLAQCENEPGFVELLDSYTGPATGLFYNDKTKKLEIANGWHADKDGNIVRYC